MLCRPMLWERWLLRNEELEHGGVVGVGHCHFLHRKAMMKRECKRLGSIIVGDECWAASLGKEGEEPSVVELVERVKPLACLLASGGVRGVDEEGRVGEGNELAGEVEGIAL